MGEAPAAIRRRIDETRGRLDRIVEEAVARMNPRARAQDVMERGRSAFREAADAAVEIPRLLAEVRNNPRPPPALSRRRPGVTQPGRSCTVSGHDEAGHPENVPAEGTTTYPQDPEKATPEGEGDFDSASRGGPKEPEDDEGKHEQRGA